jgi:hypothetical protein
MIKAGVRQGGILSPLLFAIVMDKLIKQLMSAGYGCHINQIYFGCMIYADDIILLSNSLSDMKKMLAICDVFASEIDAKFNPEKSVMMRVGDRFMIKCVPLTLSGNNLKFVNELKYLGIHIISGRSFKIATEYVKMKFYRTFNAIFAKSKSANSELVTVHLLLSYCLPLLTYAIEALCLMKTQLNALERSMNVAISKIFGFLSNDNLDVVRSMLKIPKLADVAINRKIKLFTGLVGRSYWSVLLPLLYNELC